MQKRKIVPVIIFVLGIISWFLFFRQDKTLRFIPKNADAVVLIDVKKIKRQAFCSYLMNSSGWFKKPEKTDYTNFFRNSGLKIPDYLQIFHLKNSKIFEWHSTVEIEDFNTFLRFLKDHSFVHINRDTYEKDGIFFKISNGRCLIASSNSGFNYLKNSEETFYKADQFIENSLASLSFLSNQKITNFEIDCSENEIEIKNTSNTDFFKAVLKNAATKNNFLTLELDKKNIQKLSSFFPKIFPYSSEISAVKSAVTLEQFADTIITYSYDDNFNEVEKRSFQKIIKPNYFISFQTPDTDKTWEFFKNKNWINSENQFTAIPFQPNFTSKNKSQIVVNSRKNVKKSADWLNKNYIFIKNNGLVNSSFKALKPIEKKLLYNIDLIFYANCGKDYYLKVKFKPGKSPKHF